MYFSYRIRKVPKEAASVPLDRLCKEESHTVGSRHVFVRLNRQGYGGTRRTGRNIKCETLRLRAQARNKNLRILHLPPATERAGAVAKCGFGYDAPPTAVGKLRFFALSPARRVPRPVRDAARSVRRHELCSWRGSAGADGINIPAAPRSPRQSLGGSFVTFLPAEKS